MNGRISTCTLRYGNVYGPRQNPKGEAGVVAIFATQLLRGERPTIFGDGSKTRDYVFVEDVVRANLLAMEKAPPGTCFNIGTGQPTTDQRIFDLVRAAVGANLLPIYGSKRPGEVDHICLDSSRAERELGRCPLSPLRAEFGERWPSTGRSCLGLRSCIYNHPYLVESEGAES